ncbi:MAG: hypothetical protein ACT4OU_11025 [Hyphomicrobium sp.]
MSYDIFSRAVAYLSCLSAVCLFATSMAIAAINVGATLMDSASAEAAAIHMHTASL